MLRCRLDNAGSGLPWRRAIIGDAERFSPRVDLARVLQKRRFRANVHSCQAASADVNGLDVQPERKCALGVLRP